MPNPKAMLMVLAMLSFGFTARSQVVNSSEVPQKIYDNVDNAPRFPGGVTTGMDKLLSQRFVYPLAAWQEKKLKQVEISYMVRRDGTVCCVVTQTPVHPELAEALETIIPHMPLWYPAYTKSKTTDARVGSVINLVDRKTGQPYHLQPVIKKNEPITQLQKAGTTVTESQLAAYVEPLKTITDFYPEHKQSTIALTKIYVSQGNLQQAVMLIDKAARDYQKLNIWKAGGDSLKYIVFRPGYVGKDEIAFILQRALTFDEAGRGETARRAYAKCMSVIDEKLVDQDISAPEFSNEAEEDRFWKMETIMDDLFYRLNYTDALKLTDEDRRQLTSVQRTPENVVPIVEKLIAENKIETPRTKQLVQQIKKMQMEGTSGKVSKKDMTQLYGAKAFVALLQDGPQAALDAIDTMQKDKNTSREASSYLSKIKEGINASKTQLSNHKALVEALACYAPVTDASNADGQPVVNADTFYSTREMLLNIFPAEWLIY